MKVLVVEDNRPTLHMLCKNLEKWNYQVLPMQDGESALEVIQSDHCPHLAIVDWMLPGIDGLEVCRAIRKRNEYYTYTILLTGKSELKDIIEGLESGADDYLVKPFHPQELKLRLETGLRIIRLETELLAAKEQMHKAATHDGLTGMLNRNAILYFLEKELERSKRDSSPVGVIMADLDHFKQINDTYGHIAGDTALIESSRRMRNSLRSYDACGRYGGEEFLFVLPKCDLSRTIELAERLRYVVASKPYYINQKQIEITISAGAFAIADPNTSWSIDEIIQNADLSLYHAKRKGRNRVEAPSYSPKTANNFQI